jgi:hypothetical protein
VSRPASDPPNPHASQHFFGILKTKPRRPEPRSAALVVVRHAHGGGVMHIDRAQADRFLALLGFTLSFLFLLAIVALALSVTSGKEAATPSPIAEHAPK